MTFKQVTLALSLSAALSSAQSAPPALAGVGDSICEGWTNWMTLYNCPPFGCGNPDGDIMHRVYIDSGFSITGTNFGINGGTTGFAYGAFHNDVPSGIRYLWVHAMSNDSYPPFDNTATNLNRILDLCIARNIKMLVDDNLPEGGSNVLLKNAALRNWVGTNVLAPGRCFYFPTHDAMGDPSTGFTTLLPAYADPFVPPHLSLAGDEEMAQLLLAEILLIENPTPLSVSGVTLTGVNLQ
jgi:hypothetical protein